MAEIRGSQRSYIDLLDDAIIDEMERSRTEDRKYFPLRPSSAGKCTRELTYELMEYEGKAKYDRKIEDPTRAAASNRLLALGHSVEWQLLKKMALIKDMDIKYQQQVVDLFTINGRLIEGSLDAVLISDKYKCVADVKSKGNKFSKAYASKWDEDNEWLASLKSVEQFGESAFYAKDLMSFIRDIRGEPYFVANFLQLNSYALSKFLVDRGIDHGSIVQYCKNDSYLREVRFAPSEEALELVRTKFQIASDAVKAGNPELAPKDYALGSIKCSFCPFSKECHGSSDTLKAYFKTLPAKNWPTDSKRLKSEKQIEEIYKEYKWSIEASEAKEYAEQEILKILDMEKVNKIKFSDGYVYERKFLKTPWPRMVLQRTKL